jgi:hypothetical protein
MGSSVISACIVGDALHAAHVSVSALGVRARTGCVIERFRAAPAGESARAIRALCPGGRVPARVLLTCAPAQCAVRPVAVTCAQWGRARDEVVASIDSLLPLDPADAVAGLYDVFAPGADAGRGEPVGGRLVGVRRTMIEGWIDALRAATGRERVTLLAPQMAALGLDLRRHEAAGVLETDAGAPVVHRFEHGLPVSSGDSEGLEARFALPSETPAPSGVTQVTPAELCVAAAVAERCASEVYRPLLGRSPSRAWRWAPTGVAAALAIAAALAAGPLYASRLERGAAEAQAERAAMMDDHRELLRVRQRAERLAALLERGVGRATANWDSVLPAVDDAHAALTRAGFLYRLELTDASLTMVGESDEVRSVLQRLDASPHLRGAALAAPLTASPSAEGLDVFTIRAERVRAGGGR